MGEAITNAPKAPVEQTDISTPNQSTESDASVPFKSTILPPDWEPAPPPTIEDIKAQLADPNLLPSTRKMLAQKLAGLLGNSSGAIEAAHDVAYRR